MVLRILLSDMHEAFMYSWSFKRRNSTFSLYSQNISKFFLLDYDMTIRQIIVNKTPII